jgi:hypothetical protein
LDGWVATCKTERETLLPPRGFNTNDDDDVAEKKIAAAESRSFMILWVCMN